LSAPFVFALNRKFSFSFPLLSLRFKAKGRKKKAKGDIFAIATAVGRKISLTAINQSINTSLWCNTLSYSV